MTAGFSTERLGPGPCSRWVTAPEAWSSRRPAPKETGGARSPPHLQLVLSCRLEGRLGLTCCGRPGVRRPPWGQAAGGGLSPLRPPTLRPRDRSRSSSSASQRPQACAPSGSPPLLPPAPPAAPPPPPLGPAAVSSPLCADGPAPSHHLSRAETGSIIQPTAPRTTRLPRETGWRREPPAEALLEGGASGRRSGAGAPGRGGKANALGGRLRDHPESRRN